MPLITKNIYDVIPYLEKEDVVIVPTETVYGLGCNALSYKATEKVYQVKKRPRSNPLILHVGDKASLLKYIELDQSYVLDVIDRFMPGSITIVCRAHPSLPDHVVTKSGTVAIRIPNHPLTLDLLQSISYPIAAPSANLYTKLSPTGVNEIDPTLMRRVGAVLDGGDCSIGLESTILDCTGDNPVILRHGMVVPSSIESAINREVIVPTVEFSEDMPGCSRVHYTTRAKIKIVEEIEIGKPGLTRNTPTNHLQFMMPYNATGYAQLLYKMLHYIDSMKVPVIYIESPPAGEEWNAVWDRINRASDK